MIRSLYRRRDGSMRVDLTLDELTAALKDPQGRLWVDFEGEAPEVCEPILDGVFGFHPLAVDDALRETHVPKIDDWGHFLYIVLHAVHFNRRDGDHVDTLELDIFLGKTYLVSHHDQAIPVVDHVWMACQRDGRYWEKGADHILYLLVDELVTSYMPVVEEIDEEIEQVEDRIFDRPTQSLLEQLFGLKRALLHLRRIITPQREVVNRLARDTYAVIDAEDRVFFRDVYDHLVRLHDINESLRDLVSGALDAYLSAVNNRMNEVMRTLTIITTLFMPVSFIAGFFGMNFFQPVVPLDIWTGEPAFIVTAMAMLIVPVGLYLWIRRRAWM